VPNQQAPPLLCLCWLSALEDEGEFGQEQDERDHIERVGRERFWRLPLGAGHGIPFCPDLLGCGGARGAQPQPAFVGS
jgi:hypothetical protein